MATCNKCGGRCSKYSNNTCPKCHKKRMTDIHAEIGKIVKSGKCPDCGRGLRRNMALSGWWQCVQYGAVGFRAEADKPSCNWQGFTE